MDKIHPERIGFLLFAGINALDLIGPHEVLSRIGAECILIGESYDTVVSDRGIRFAPDTDYASCPNLDVLVVPGGPGQTPAMDNEKLISFIRAQNEKVRYIAGVCTGSLLLAKAGVLCRRCGTTHWLAVHALADMNVTVTRNRVVWDGNIVTGAGVSAGIDMALDLVAALRSKKDAMQVELEIEYDPKPPFNTGSPERAPKELVDLLRSKSRFIQRDQVA